MGGRHHLCRHRRGICLVAVILDAWSRRVVGYAINRSIDVRLTISALNVAIERRKPPPGCVHHSDRGSQYAAQAYRDALVGHRLIGSMGRRGNPYDNAKAESFMKTLKVEAVYPMVYDAFQIVVAVGKTPSRRGGDIALVQYMSGNGGRHGNELDRLKSSTVLRSWSFYVSDLR